MHELDKAVHVIIGPFKFIVVWLKGKKMDGREHPHGVKVGWNQIEKYY